MKSLTNSINQTHEAADGKKESEESMMEFGLLYSEQSDIK